MKKSTAIILIAFFAALLGCSDDNEDGGINQTAQAEQYTPDQANWESFSSKPFQNGTNTSHDPDGVGWISQVDWEASRWDGTVFDPSQMSKDEFACAICPSGDRIRGIREVFYAENPFVDNSNPTKAEVDEWHRIAINHVRSLVGYTAAERQVQKDHCLFSRALWGDERKFTTMWDSQYPGENGSAAGPCQGSGNAHCGASFIPNFQDQVPYLPQGHEGCSAGAGAEGVFNASKSNIPWSIKWSRSFCSALKTEGFWGGHVGPRFHREKFGFSFWDSKPQDNNSIAVLRAKWGGKLLDNVYCNPNSDPECVPDTIKEFDSYCL